MKNCKRTSPVLQNHCQFWSLYPCMNLHLSPESFQQNSNGVLPQQKNQSSFTPEIPATDQFTVQKCFAPFHVQSEKNPKSMASATSWNPIPLGSELRYHAKKDGAVFWASGPMQFKSQRVHMVFMCSIWVQGMSAVLKRLHIYLQRFHRIHRPPASCL